MVSIIITLYNKQNTIDRAIQSALKQSYSNCEVIVVDDCSTDKSPEICAKYGDKIRVIRSDKNRGLPYSRQIGINHAHGQFITFIDADDYLDTKAIEYCVETQESSSVDIVQMKIFRRIEKYGISIPFKSKYDSSHALEACLYNEQFYPIQCWGKLYKTKLLKTTKYIDYNGFWGEDRIFNIPIFATNPTFAIAKNGKYNYTLGGTTSSNFDIDTFQEYKIVYQLKRDWAISNGYERYIPSMQNELLELLKYHVRHLINSKTMSDTDATNWLKKELSLPFWSSFNANLDAITIYNSENKSTTRKLKKQISKILTQF